LAGRRLAFRFSYFPHVPPFASKTFEHEVKLTSERLLMAQSLADALKAYFPKRNRKAVALWGVQHNTLAETITV
jgi:hypothetical protein